MMEKRRTVGFVLLTVVFFASFAFLLVSTIERQDDYDALAVALASDRRSLLLADPKTVLLRTSSPLDRVQEDLLASNYTLTAPPTTLLRPYSMDAVIRTVPHFTKQFFVFLYVARTDEFVALYDTKQPWSSGAGRILSCARVVEQALRRNFPWRFTGRNGGRDLALLASVGDSPKLKAQCIDTLPLVEDGGEVWPEKYVCGNDEMAPILGFGSVFTDGRVLPSLVTMPMAAPPHMPCFEWWLQGLGVCPGLLPRFRVESLAFGIGGKKVDHVEGLVFGEDVGLVWEDLIPSVVWRGTDFGFLLTMYPELRRPEYETDVFPKLAQTSPGNNVAAAAASPNQVVRALLDSFDTYLPRWKGAILTAEAELDVREGAVAIAFERKRQNITIPSDAPTRNVPWCNIKFSHYILNHAKTPTSKSQYFQQWEQLGIHAGGEVMDMLEHAKYKYQIDLGGGGGTTWTGTLLKLSLPGLLFHHETPTKDWLHDHIQAWVHYVPVKVDLSDLREKFLWAELHPGQARRIAMRATEFMRRLGTVEGFGPVYDHYFYDNLKTIIDAYQLPVDPNGNNGSAADEAALNKLQAQLPNHEVVMRCLSDTSRFTLNKHQGCEMYRGDKVKKGQLMRTKKWSDIY